MTVPVALMLKPIFAQHSSVNPDLQHGTMGEKDSMISAKVSPIV